MNASLSPTQKRWLEIVFERGAESATQALSQWLGRAVRLTVSAVEDVELSAASSVLGAEDELVAACAMTVSGAVDGLILLVFEDAAGLALADLLLQQPPGTSTAWGDLERSAACETANIVGCAYLNSLAMHLPTATPGSEQQIAPGPPTFRHEFAASLLEFAVMDQAIESDRLLLINTVFAAEGTRLDWTLLFVPGHGSLGTLTGAVSG